MFYCIQQQVCFIMKNAIISSTSSIRYCATIMGFFFLHYITSFLTTKCVDIYNAKQQHKNFNLTFYVSVSPEVLGFLTAIGLFIILMTFLFWYLNNKLALENTGSLHCLDDFRKNPELQGESVCIYMCFYALYDIYFFHNKSFQQTSHHYFQMSHGSWML